MRVSKIGSFACLRVSGLCDGKAGKCANVSERSLSLFSCGSAKKLNFIFNMSIVSMKNFTVEFCLNIYTKILLLTVMLPCV